MSTFDIIQDRIDDRMQEARETQHEQAIIASGERFCISCQESFPEEKLRFIDGEYICLRCRGMNSECCIACVTDQESKKIILHPVQDQIGNCDLCRKPQIYNNGAWEKYL